MRGLKIIGLLFIILAIFLSYPVCQQLFAKNEKTGIRITAICDESKMSGTENKVYILKPGEYRQYIDDMLKIKEIPVSGKTP